MILILKLYFFVIVMFQHSNACIYQLCEIGNRSAEHHKLAPSMYLCIYNILTMCSRFNANKMLINY
jgi:hypothetical protein